MNRPSTGLRAALVATALTAMLAVTGCEEQDKNMDAQDAAGVTLAEAEQLSLEDQFAVFGERYAHVQDLLTEAQQQVSDDEWQWSGEATIPWAGAAAPNQLPGSNETNSYFMQTSRSIELPGATGAIEDTEPMISYFEEQGWETSLTELDGDRHWVRAETGDGFWLEYMVQPNGQYNVGVLSEMFWGDYPGLLEAISGRVPADAILSESIPGVFTPFPSWDDPIVDAARP